MGFGMFSAQASPIAIDFGSASVKLLQIGSGERPTLVAAAELPVPDSVRGDVEKLSEFYSEWLPKILREGRFKGKRAVIAIPSSQSFIQHMQITEAAAANKDDAIKGQLQTQMGIAPNGVVVRSMEVCSVHRNGEALREVICLAITKDAVMRHVNVLRKCKLEAVGVHTDMMAMVRAFDHINRREVDGTVCTMYVDLGWGGTRVAVTHGQQVMFARSIPIGGKHFDQLIASTLKCDVSSARAHRLTLQSSMPSAQAAAAPQAEGMTILNAAVKAGMVGGSGQAGAASGGTAVAADRRSGRVPPALTPPLAGKEAPRKAVHVDLSELLDTVTDELSMCLRYHQSLFRDQTIDRAIFVGGESRQAWLCQHLVKVMRMSAQMGDPLARLDITHAPLTPGLTLGVPQPGWAVACGLCTAPTDL